MTETREEAIARLERAGQLDRNCLDCQEVYRSPQMPFDVMGPRHQPSQRCESGKRPHCTCDTCF
jgi:hypothetical protein